MSDDFVIGRLDLPEGAKEQPIKGLPLTGAAPKPEPSYQLDGLLKRTGEWVALKSCDDKSDAHDLLADCSYQLGWVYTEDVHIDTTEFAAYRLRTVYIVTWYL
jgi:hypothetical protein